MRRVSPVIALGTGCLFGMLLGGALPVASSLFERTAHGQDDDEKPSKSKTPKSKATKSTGKKKTIANVQGLDVRAEQVQTSFIKDAQDLAGQYVEAGHLEKAKTLLQSALTLNPEADDIKQKIKKLDETILTSNDKEIEVNPARGWEPANAQVFENRPIRFQVDGTYRVVLNTPIGAGGFPTKDPVTDMVGEIPSGCLMGMIVKDGKPGKPFAIGEGRDYTPKETGVLFLRVNLPSDNKNAGKLKVSISGYVKGAAAS